jgi:hypothetical protein
MKTTIVPAQVTTVEDRVTANLGISQLILFITPLFIGALLYWALPPTMDFSLYKLIFIALLTLTCLILAIRIGGKRTLSNREDFPKVQLKSTQTKKVAKQPVVINIPKLSMRQSAYAYATLDDPVNRLNFETNKKGVLNVRITEIQD